MPRPIKKQPNEHIPTRKTRQWVLAAVAANQPQEAIAACLEITVMTLRKHYEKELATGRTDFAALAAEQLYKLLKKGSLGATKYALDNMAGFAILRKEAEANAQPVQPPAINVNFVQAPPRPADPKPDPDEDEDDDGYSR